MPPPCCYWQEQWLSMWRSGVIILRSSGLSSNVCWASFCEHGPPLEVVDFTNGGGLELPFPPSPDALSKCLNQRLSFHALSPCVFVYTVLSVHVGSVMHLFADDCYFWGRPLGLGSLLGIQNEKCSFSRRGVTWSNFRLWRTSLAALFWTFCSRFSEVELQ